MQKYQAILFDLDDTLIDRNKALQELFSIILKKCYGEVKQSLRSEMMERFIQLDSKGVTTDKTLVLEALFDSYPPIERIASNSINDFWSAVFPSCFNVSEETFGIIESLSKQVKIAIITNGKTIRQKAKIKNTKLDQYFETILISEEAGFSKPNKEIFELALSKLAVLAENTIFVGDNLLVDIGGCQSAGIKGVWFNPNNSISNTDIKPFMEIKSLNELLEVIQ